MRDFCISPDGTICPAKGKGALACSSYKECKYVNNRDYYYEMELLKMENETEQTNEKYVIDRFISLTDEEKRNELKTYKRLIDLYEKK